MPQTGNSGASDPPAAVRLTNSFNVAAETAIQSSNSSFYFALADDTSGANLFVGPIVIEGQGAQLTVNDSNNNFGSIVYAAAPGVGRVTLNASAADATNSFVTIDGGAAAVPGAFQIFMNGPIANGSILNYNPNVTQPSQGPLTQLGNPGGEVQVIGPEGAGQVYDAVNNPILRQANVHEFGQYNGNFGTIVDASYIPVQTGYYLVTYELICTGSGISWGSPAGSAIVTAGVTLTNGSFNWIPNSAVSWTGIQQGPFTDTRQVLVHLTGGTPVYNDFQATGSPVAGSTGGLNIYIQPFACNYSVLSSA